MSAVKRLIIDIGTNSVLALTTIVEGRHLNIISDKKSTTKLGQGLAVSGNLSDDGMKRTLEAVTGFSRESGSKEVFIIGTEALRQAKNSARFAGLLFEATGLNLIIINGKLEAELAFLGAIYNLPIISRNIVLIDVGGGSTEIVSARDCVIEFINSFKIGALKLKELCNSDTAEEYIKVASEYFDFAGTKFGDDHDLLATGGTITSLGALKLSMNAYDPGPLHGSVMKASEITKICSKFEAGDRATRQRMMPFDIERADILLPGAGILLALMSIMQKDEVIISTGGLRFGAALYPEKIPTENQT